MIDIENELFTLVENSIKAAFSGCAVKGVLDLNPAEFPCVCFCEINNQSRTHDSSGIEKYAEIQYEANIFANPASGGKQQAKSIAKTLDGVMTAKGFNRFSSIQVPTGNPTIIRYTIRYRAIVDYKNNIYWR